MLRVSPTLTFVPNRDITLEDLLSSPIGEFGVMEKPIERAVGSRNTRLGLGENSLRVDVWPDGKLSFWCRAVGNDPTEILAAISVALNTTFIWPEHISVWVHNEERLLQSLTAPLSRVLPKGDDGWATLKAREAPMLYMAMRQEQQPTPLSIEQAASVFLAAGLSPALSCVADLPSLSAAYDARRAMK